MRIAVETLSGCGRTTRVQIATDGRWEHAVLASARQGLPAPGVLRALLERGSDVALEAFFGDVHEFFLGIRLTPQQAEMRTVASLASSLLEATSPLSAIEVLRENVHRELFATQAIRIELGVVNHWRSYGSTVLWRKGQEPLADVDDAVRETIQVFGEAAPPIACEVASDAPQPHWVGLPVVVVAGSATVPTNGDLLHPLMQRVVGDATRRGRQAGRCR